mgnify:CR=1 FL=1
MAETAIEREATIFNIQKYNMYDGPGVRTMNSLQTSGHTGAAIYTGRFLEQDSRTAFHPFRIGAPLTAQRTALKKNQCTHTGTVIHIVFLNVETQSWHAVNFQ